MKLISRLAWLCLGAMSAIYSVMVGITLPRIAAEAGGLMPFDLRPLGYTLAEAKAFLTGLSPVGKDIYLSVQHKLDLAYPALLAVTLALAIVLLAPSRWRKFRWLVALLPIPGAVFDYLENDLVAQMLNTAPHALTPKLVVMASQWTVLKSATSALAITFVLLLLVGWLYRRLAGRAF